jgi:hypothetical protein
MTASFYVKKFHFLNAANPCGHGAFVAVQKESMK